MVPRNSRKRESVCLATFKENRRVAGTPNAMRDESENHVQRGKMDDTCDHDLPIKPLRGIKPPTS